MTEHGGSTSGSAARPSLSGEALVDVIRRCQDGEVAAFAMLFDAYNRRVFTVAYALTADYATASDVVQEVFVKLLTRIRQFRFGSAFETWLHRIVLNAAHDQRRVPRTETLPDEHRSQTTKAPQLEAVENSEVERAVRQAIARLTPKLREPIVLRYLSELSYEEIATVLGVSPGTVASRLARGHAALAKRLGHLRTSAGGTR